MGAVNQRTAQSVDAVVAEIDTAVERIAEARAAIGKVIYGQGDVIDQALTTILSGGHGLLVGVPGLAKTKLVETLGIVLGLDSMRIQFTPDLMPSDILGSEVLDTAADGSRSFRFVPGPTFTQLLMADEINRASPRTQSALLQAMQEYHVTIAGQRHDLPRPFHVLATQNPIEQEGTYPLPEAQLDRFLLQIDVTYPDREAERQVLIETTGAAEPTANAVMDATEIASLQQLVRTPADRRIRGRRHSRPRALGPARRDRRSASRRGDLLGPGPRASQALMLACRARALIDGRYTPSIDDVQALAIPVLQHRMALSFAARAEDLTVRDVIADLAARLG